MNLYNKYFDIGNHVGSVISESEFQVLMASGKIWGTDATLSQTEAWLAFGGQISDYNPDTCTYGGLIVADSKEHAELIAKERGWNEVVTNPIVNIIAENSPPEEKINVN